MGTSDRADGPPGSDAARTLKLVGGYGSPYSRKMRAVLRYRQIPFRWIPRGSSQDRDIPPVPVRLIPVLVFPGEGAAADEAMIDSTPQIRRLEAEYSGRSIIPPDPGMAFLDALVEDYADEWLTKAMFHYRWAFEPDIAKASQVLALHHHLQLDAEGLAGAAQQFGERQVGRLGVVGSNATTAPVIEGSYERFLRIFSELLVGQTFVLGERPGTGDFGIFGQLSQLILFDPTSARVAERVAPRVVAWMDSVEDLSWWEVSDDGWLGRDAAASVLRPLLGEIGRVYVPFLLANAAALSSGTEQVECEIDGQKWVQQSFPYQGKCLRWLREARAALAAGDREFVDQTLRGTGCEALFD